MKTIMMLSIVVVVVVLCGCGKEKASNDTLSHAERSEEFVERVLAERGIALGRDSEHERIVSVAAYDIPLKSKSDEDGIRFKDVYDFQDDVNDDFETKRFKAMWKAYASGLAEIAENLTTNLSFKTEEEAQREAGQSVAESSAKCTLDGVVTITMAESLIEDRYEVSVAVCQSKNRKEQVCGLNGSTSRPGKYTLAEWLERQSGTGIVCPNSYCDNEGVWWRVAGVPVALDSGRKSKKFAESLEKAKLYAYEAALRTIAVEVTATRTSRSILQNDSVTEDFKSKVKIVPVNEVRPVDPSQVKWIELDRDDPFTGKPVRLVIAAIRSGK